MGGRVMYDFVIVHGSYGSPFENWFSWLYKELENRGKKVLVPHFPCGADEQNYSNWSKVLEAYDRFIDEHTCFVGHSLAPAFIVDYVIEHKQKVNNLYLVAPFYGRINIPEFDLVNERFFFIDDLAQITDYIHASHCYISRNDPYVPSSLSDSFANAIQADKVFIDGAGHFNSAAGYSTFSQLLEQIVCDGNG